MSSFQLFKTRCPHALSGAEQSLSGISCRWEWWVCSGPGAAWVLGQKRFLGSQSSCNCPSRTWWPWWIQKRCGKNTSDNTLLIINMQVGNSYTFHGWGNVAKLAWQVKGKALIHEDHCVGVHWAKVPYCVSCFLLISLIRFILQGDRKLKPQGECLNGTKTGKPNGSMRYRAV